MKKLLMIGGGVLLLILAIGILVMAYVFLNPAPGTEAPPAGSGNPFGTLFSGSSGTEEHLTITLTDGSSATVPDFTSSNQPEVASDTNGYQVAGASEESFQILYFPLDSGFLVTLNAEPLGSVRLEAEAALREELGLTNAELCKLRADVGTTYSVSSTYAGKNLGLSFCPGATVLP